ncbi:MAG: DNA topoisomerase 3 [Defluviitaleaceae bacterium]|nr:DNA topoisomerase 3 [Defluviitaleaceae bacterium]
MLNLVIAEKPSVSKALADVLGAKTRRDGSYEGNGYVISWCVGHLLGLAEPQTYDEKYAKWRYADLPIAPHEWKYTATASTKKQLKILVDLMKRKDIDTIINACDAGREGELIFRLVYEHAKCKKPIKRLWISSMEESAIADGFRNLKDGKEYDGLFHSSKCRQQADWLVGMNYSRLFSVLYNAQLRVGRVQTPTLAMIVEREDKIASFTKEPYYTVEITNGDMKAERKKVTDINEAEAIAEACDNKNAVVKSVERKDKTESAPKLYDLTTLQREANRLFGYTAAQTLNAVQNLYEQKIVTYPRTDSRFITEDMAIGIPPLVIDVAEKLPFSVGNLSINPAQVVNNAKVTDHHAIIPTSTMPNADITSLPTAERNILLMICTRFISALSDKHQYAETVITLDCEGEAFTAKGKTITHNGWKAVEQSFFVSIGKSKKDEEKPLPELSEGEQFAVNAFVREGFTKPPKHYTEDLLLSAMEMAGAEDMPDDVERKGLGTPATRAAIIENLVKSGLLARKDKLLLPTEKGVNLIKVLPDTVKSPKLTAEWEHELKNIEHGKQTADAFMTAINQSVAETVKSHHTAPDELKALFPSSRPLTSGGEGIGKCPRCNGGIVESPKGFFCDNKGCKFAIFKESKYFTTKRVTLTKEIAIALVTEGRIFLKGLHSEKTSKPYNATIILDDNGEGYPSFKIDFESKGTVKNG